MLRYCSIALVACGFYSCTDSQSTQRAETGRDASAPDDTVSTPAQPNPNEPRDDDDAGALPSLRPEPASTPAPSPPPNPSPDPASTLEPEPNPEPTPEPEPTPANPTAGTLAERYPSDAELARDDAVLFFDDFETGWGRWDSPNDDTQHLFLESDSAVAHAGERYLRSTVTRQQLQDDEYISAAPQVSFARPVDTVYFRYHVRFPVLAPNPHHWLRLEAGNADYGSSGLANTVPPGDEGFWFDFDSNDDDVFNFYVYWYQMRSGRCNDGSATPGCAGDQGSTYYYGNVFQPAEQAPFLRDEWFCVELAAGVNEVGQSDGWLAFWVDDELVGRYEPGAPIGTWLRSSFHEGGCEFSACSEPVPFEGFDFRSAPDVQFKRLILDAYYERGSSEDRRQRLEERGLSLSDEYTILYDDIVVATERIGCRR
jgi:hypothetical protein